ncbi:MULTISPECIES: hypothetical protein [Sulfurimonas]|uniref:hypothetical protein n=1 Tax=Sulfurimonas TaxID=202746 RepID=UPI0012645893|nr:hypothetical protein [Sulfurimonas indica]
MKLSNIALSLALIGTMSLGMAEDTTASVETTTTTEPTVSVDTQIAEIQAAPAQERVRLMNQFKQRLATMNEADRAAAIEQLQTRMQTRTQTRAQDATAQSEEATQAMTQTRTRMQTRTQEHVQEMQMQTNEQMMQMQNMNQNRAGNQFMNGGAAVSGGATSPMNFPNR